MNQFEFNLLGGIILLIAVSVFATGSVVYIQKGKTNWWYIISFILICICLALSTVPNTWLNPD